MLKIGQYEYYDINSLLDPQTQQPIVEGKIIGYGVHQGIEGNTVAEAIEQYQNNQVKLQRKAAYKEESDPLYMEFLFDESVLKKQQWKDKVTEIKQRFPLHLPLQ
ncbi:hypothetical protein PCIT_a2996 [Pseudoalteromonas citrea]|uniref:Uncharacterized protein n=2 Tax=Pseudoalteromonas citrea TaxID=43655 RepID=A0AAD4FRM8_9GAMM|nr:hypothetical protein [Pseudoalteromonas citrea]KAF7770047.1 hypothetical protein PCIT_a2996 [Pseudoalteromonas citrea]